MKTDWLTEKYGSAIGTYLRSKMRDAQKNCFHIDNERACETSKPNEVIAYELARESGCCGSVDKTAFHPNGRVFRYGFNHGH